LYTSVAGELTLHCRDTRALRVPAGVFALEHVPPAAPYVKPSAK